MDREESIRKVISRFDFQKVHRVMTALDWRWVGTGIPSVRELQSEATRLLQNVGGKIKSSETGGLKAEYKSDIDGGQELRLYFVAEQSFWNSYRLSVHYAG